MAITLEQAKEILKQHGYLVKNLWNKTDITDRAKDLDMVLTADEISEIAFNIEQRFDATYGITWDVIDLHLDEMRYKKLNTKD